KTHQPAPLRDRVPGIPQEVETLCLRCLAKAPDRRPSAAELAGEFSRLLGVTRSGSPMNQAAAMAPGVPARLRWRLAAGLGVVAALGVIAVAAWQPWRHDAQKEGTPAGGRAEADSRAGALGVTALRVEHRARVGDGGVDKGVLGDRSQEVGCDDTVRIAVEL